MNDAAESLADARKFCSPKPLEGATLEQFWVETKHARDEKTDFRAQLGRLLESDDCAKVLVHGHRGCGKSTELNKFRSELGGEWLPIALNASDFLQTSGNEAADVLLAICTRVVEVCEEKKLPVSPDRLKVVLAFFAETIEKSEQSRASDVKAEAGADSDETLWGKLLGLKASLKTALKFGSRNETSTVSKVRQRKGDLCAAADALLMEAESAWNDRFQGQSDQTKGKHGKVLLIVEDLDKLGLSDARQVFVQDGRILSDIKSRAVFTIPVFTFHSAEANAIRAMFGLDLALPMIKVRDQKRVRVEAGHKTLAKLVRKRVNSKVLDNEALELLIDSTGGVLRHLFEAIQVSAQFTEVNERGVIDRDAIKEALSRMVSNIGLQISYPPEERKSPKPLQEKLAEIARKQAKHEVIRAQPDPEIQILLMSGALLEYNGEGWLGVHPLALRYLRQLGYDVGSE